MYPLLLHSTNVQCNGSHRILNLQVPKISQSNRNSQNIEHLLIHSPKLMGLRDTILQNCWVTWNPWKSYKRSHFFEKIPPPSQLLSFVVKSLYNFLESPCQEQILHLKKALSYCQVIHTSQWIWLSRIFFVPHKQSKCYASHSASIEDTRCSEVLSL